MLPLDSIDTYKQKGAPTKLWKPPPMSLDDSHWSNNDNSKRRFECESNSVRGPSKYTNEYSERFYDYKEPRKEKNYFLHENSYPYKRKMRDQFHAFDRHYYRDSHHAFSSDKYSQIGKSPRSNSPHSFYRYREEVPLKPPTKHYYDNRPYDRSTNVHTFIPDRRNDRSFRKDSNYEGPTRNYIKASSKLDIPHNQPYLSNINTQYSKRNNVGDSNRNKKRELKGHQLDNSPETDSFSDISSSSYSPSPRDDVKLDTSPKNPSNSIQKPCQINKKVETIPTERYKNLANLSRTDLEKLIPHMNDIDSKYEKICQIGEGTYGKVYKGIVKGTENGIPKYVAMKKVRMECEKEGFPITATREVKILSSMNHNNIIRLIEIVTSKGNSTLFKSRICVYGF